MAVYRLFPTKDASIFTYYPDKNTGLDEILDISIYKSVEETGEVARSLVAFDNTQISDVLTNKIGGANYKAYLKLFLAEASGVPVEYKLLCYPLSGSWNNGTGRTSNVPETTNGVSWHYSNYASSSIFTASVAGSVSYYPAHAVGGGAWYSSYLSTQSFNLLDSKDIEMDVTTAVSSSYYQDGFILFHSGSLEFSTSSLFELKYFSRDTHTIYPPCLEFRWDDFTYSTGSLSVVDNDHVVVSLNNNKGEYFEDSVNRFRVNVRDRYPTRTFQTSSLYTTNKALPTASYYAIKDIKTEEIIIDFDTSYTKLSCDSTGNYFDVYMNGLQPERYYKILIKTIIDNNTIVFEDNNYFKIVK